MEQFEEKRIVEIVGSLRVCAGGHCTEQDEENTCPWSCGDETCLKKQQEDAANLIESLQAQLADKTALLDAAIAGQETLQRALSESQQRERADDRKHGIWIKRPFPHIGGEFRCPHCNGIFGIELERYDFCPSCGNWVNGPQKAGEGKNDA